MGRQEKSDVFDTKSETEFTGVVHTGALRGTHMAMHRRSRRGQPSMMPAYLENAGLSASHADAWPMSSSSAAVNSAIPS